VDDTINDPLDIEQFAMFMQARDARLHGMRFDGVHHPTWEECGPIGQADYRRDADTYLTALRHLGWTKKETDRD